MKFNESCYTLEEINYPKGIFDNSVDITYVITMDNATERQKKVYNQLNKFRPTKKVIIVKNKGFRKCDKHDYNHNKIDISYKDLTYTNMYIFHLAKKYNHILILEDDFIFSNKLLNNKITNSINQFIIDKNPNIYYLGCLPYIFNIFNNSHPNVCLSTATHAVIYGKTIREYLGKVYKHKTNYKDIDVMTGTLSGMYMYKEPLSIQLVLETENKKNWGHGGILTKLGGLLLTKFMNVLELDKEENIEYKWNNLYHKLFIFNIILYLLIYYIVYLGVTKIFK